ncbi:MAG: CoA pyrophosphatase [Pseudomonadota bacterium]
MTYTREDVAAALALPPGAARSDDDLNPSHRIVPDRPRRLAAVLCALREGPAGLSVVLTRRAAHLRDHAGQISFPGGKVAAEDPSPLAAALREAEEEVGLAPRQVEILGALDSYRTSTGYEIRPFVGVVRGAWQPVPDPGEVAEVFEPPLAFLMDPANRVRASREWKGASRQFYAMPWGGYYIWGATAGMLKGLSDRLRSAQTLGIARPAQPVETPGAA